MLHLFKNKASKNGKSNANPFNEAPFAQQQKNEDPAPMFFESEEGKARYTLEHRIIRDQYLADPRSVIGAVLSVDGLFHLYDTSFRRLGLTSPYSKEDFRVFPMKHDNNLLSVMADLPKPSYVPLCYRFYFVFDASYKKPAYFTIEKGEQGGFLCQWDHNVHRNIYPIASPAFDETNDAVMRAIEAKIIIDLYSRNLF